MSTWSTARPDWESRIVARQSLLPDNLPIDRERADRALRIFKRLRLVDVPGQPTMEQACPQWLLDFVEVIFGAYDAKAKRQLIREFFFCVAKKNGKSSIAAGVMLTALVMHTRHNEEFLILAPTKDVADNSFVPAYEMVKIDAELMKRFKPSDSVREIVNRLDGSILSVKSADAEVLGGQKATSIFVDELWLFGKKASAKNILSEATGSMAARPDGFAIYASTQSDDQPAGVFAEKLQYYREIRDGKRADPARLPLIYEYPKGMQTAKAWKDPGTWYIPNPSLGRSVDPEWISSKLSEAEAEGEHSVRLFCAKHFNIQIGIGLTPDRWRGADYWESRADKSLTFAGLLERCEVVVAAVDGGGLDDMLALALVGRERNTRRWLCWNKTWLHRSVLELRKSEASRFLDFEKAGELVIVDDMLHAFADLAGCIQAADEAGTLPDKNAIGFDPMGVGLIVEALSEIGLAGEGRVIGIPQGWKLNGAIKTTEVKLASGELLHGGQKITAYAAGNAKVEPKGNAITITKQTAGTAKIDPVMAIIIGVAVMSLNPQSDQLSESDIRFL